MPENPATPQHKHHHQSPVWLFAILAGTVFIIEALCMLLLDALPPMSKPALAFVDAGLLTILLFPAFFWFLFRPLRQTIRGLQLAESEVQRYSRFFNPDYPLGRKMMARQVARQIRARPELANIRIIAMTASALAEDKACNMAT